MNPYQPPHAECHCYETTPSERLVGFIGNVLSAVAGIILAPLSIPVLVLVILGCMVYWSVEDELRARRILKQLQKEDE